jgi:hypothetical protein
MIKQKNTVTSIGTLRTVTGIGRFGSEGFWVRDYRGGVRVGRPFGAR